MVLSTCMSLFNNFAPTSILFKLIKVFHQAQNLTVSLVHQCGFPSSQIILPLNVVIIVFLSRVYLPVEFYYLLMQMHGLRVQKPLLVAV